MAFICPLKAQSNDSTQRLIHSADLALPDVIVSSDTFTCPMRTIEPGGGGPGGGGGTKAHGFVS
jgi:hypothetical protein